MDLPPPHDWPPGSSNLSTWGDSIWGFIKENVAQQSYTNNEELKQAVKDASNQVLRQMHGRVSDRSRRRINM